MATPTIGSEELFDLCCSICAVNGLQVEARKFCRDCDAYLCDECTKHHKKFPSLAKHIVTGVPEEGSSYREPTSLDTVSEDLPKCVYHHGNDITRFCPEHDELCCTVCTAVKHRSCYSVIEISEAAKDLKQSKDYAEKKKSFEDILASLHNSSAENRNLMSKVKLQREKDLDDVDKYEEELIAKIKELSCESKHKVKVRYDVIEAAIQKDSSHFEVIIASTTRAQNLLVSSDDIKAFIQTKHSDSVVPEAQDFLQQISATHKIHESNFVRNGAILEHLNTYSSLLVDVKEKECVKEYEAVFIRTYLANANTDLVTGLCMLDNGDVVLAYCTNKRLRIVNKNFEEKASLDLPTCPIDLCQTAKNEVVTSLRDLKKVQYISTDSGKLTCTSAIDVGCRCWGVAFVPEKNHLIVNCDPKIKIYDSASRKFVHIINRSIEWSVPRTSARLCTYNSALRMIVLADYDAGLFAMNLEGKLLWHSTETELKQSVGVCVLPSGIILVCSYESDKILQLDRSGKMIGTLVEGLGRPYSMVYDKQNLRLLVGCNKTLSVFALMKKQ